MVYWLLMRVLSLFLDLFASLGIANSDKDLEIILLRQQVRILHAAEIEHFATNFSF